VTGDCGDSGDSGDSDDSVSQLANWPSNYGDSDDSVSQLANWPSNYLYAELFAVSFGLEMTAISNQNNSNKVPVHIFTDCMPGKFAIKRLFVIISFLKKLLLN
jgi:hypothetical protein